jgi:hypothetical protein
MNDNWCNDLIGTWEVLGPNQQQGISLCAQTLSHPLENSTSRQPFPEPGIDFGVFVFCEKGSRHLVL